MNHIYRLRVIALCLSISCLASTALSQAVSRDNPLLYRDQRMDKALNAHDASTTRSSSSASSELIIQSFIVAESKFRDTLKNFSFKRDVLLQTIGPDGAVSGEYIRNSVFVLSDRGQRIERVTFHPKPTMKGLTITREDVLDLAGSQLFGLELTELSSYNLSYLEERQLNNRRVFVLAINPKQTPDPYHMQLRFFVGQVWLDAETFQPIRLEGVTEPQGKQRFPKFTTDRNLAMGDLIFPSTTVADDVLHFPKRDVHYRISVRYYDFKRFASQVNIVELQ
jgi:hypothetical protein